MNDRMGSICPFMSGPIVLPTGSGVFYPTARDAMCLREDCVMWQTYGPGASEQFDSGMCVLKWAALALIQASTPKPEPK